MLHLKASKKEREQTTKVKTICKSGINFECRTKNQVFQINSMHKKNLTNDVNSNAIKYSESRVKSLDT